MYLSQGASPNTGASSITRNATQAWPQISHVRTECVWIDPSAASVEKAPALFIVQDSTVSDLIEAGLPEDKILANSASGPRFSARQRTELIARSNAQGHNIKGVPPGDKSQSLVRHVEGWIRCDADGDNVSELLHVHLLGSSQNLVMWERCDEIPPSLFHPLPRARPRHRPVPGRHGHGPATG